MFQRKYALLLTVFLFFGFNESIFSPAIPAIAQSVEQSRSKADQLERQGISYLQARQVGATFKAWQEALAIYRKIGDKYQEGRLLSNFGQLYLKLKNYDKANEAFQASLALLKNTDKKELLQSVLLFLGRTNRELKKPSEAISYYQQALAVARELNDAKGKVEALGNLGDIYSGLKNYSLAAASYQEVVVIAQKINDPSILAMSLKRLADTYYLLGNCPYAQAFYEWGIKVAEPLNNPEQKLGFFQNHGNATYCQGKFKIALDSYEKALEIAKQLNQEESIGELTGNIGLVNIHLKNFAKAIEYIQQDLTIARKLGRKQAEGQALGMLGDAYYHQANYQQALNYYQQSLNLAQSVGYSRGVGLMLTNIGACLLELNQLSDAEKNLRKSIQVLQEFRESGGGREEDSLALFDRETRTYRVLQEVLIKANKIESALEVAEAGRSRVFLEFLAKQNKKPKVNSISIQDIKSLAAQEQATLVEYSVVYNLDEYKDKQAKLYIWAVQPDGKVTFAQVNLASANISLDDLVNNSRSALGVGGRGLVVRATGPDQQQKSLQQLYQLLIEPIAATLPVNPDAKVIFIPHEALFLVPFPALQTKDNTYLIQSHTILTAPSVQSLQFIGQSQDISPKTALVIGNPTMPSVKGSPSQKPEQLASLPGAEQEAKTIAQLLKTSPIVGSQATKANLLPKMQQSDIIHLATHGLLDVASDGTLNTKYAGYRVGGAVALAPQGNDSGLLTVDEIINLKLKADLVVLSACDTAQGKIVGDGVIGLSRAFLSAGAKNVIVSLWAVPDAPTAQLMTEFYRQLDGNPDKARALRQAMLITLKQHPNPRDWSAFTLIGR